MGSFLPQWLTSFSRWASPALVFVSACGGSASVQRVRGDVTSLGRYIPPSAYAYYMGGLRDEAQGNVERAEQLYLATLRIDPESGAAWAGLIRTGCRISLEHINNLADSARSAGDRPALALVALANCLLKPQFETQGTGPELLKSSEQAALEALKAEPQLLAASLALEQALLSLGASERAARVCPAYELYTNRSCRSSARDQAALADLATEDTSDDLHVQQKLSALDALLLNGQVNRGFDVAAGLMTSGEFSLRLLALGMASSASKHADFVLLNDSDDLNALLVVCLAKRPIDPATITLIAAQMIDGQFELAPLGRALFLVELARVEPQTAARLLSNDAFALSAEEDQLLAWWLQQLEATLQ